MNPTEMFSILFCGELAATALALVLAFVGRRSPVRSGGDSDASAGTRAADARTSDERSDGRARFRAGRS